MSAAAGYLGVDLGGSGAKAGVFGEAGELLGFGQVSAPVQATPEGYSEVPIESVYEAAREASRQAIAQAGRRIRALAVASQGQTFVSLDAGGRPLHPAILWYDSRASEQAQRLTEALAQAAGAERKPVVQAISTAPKILWLRQHQPQAMARAARYLLLPDYLCWRLTGTPVTDSNTAMSTGLYAEDARDYCAAALQAAQIRPDELARIAQPGAPVATLRPEAAAEWGLEPDTLLVCGTNDQYAGALGAGNCAPGIVSETSGTCLALVTLTERLPEPLPVGLLGGRFPIQRYQFALAYAKTAGLVLDWLRREMCPGRSLEDLEQLAAAVPPGSHGLTVLPHFDGTVSPRPDPAVRGVFADLNLGHTLGDLYRAILESLSFSLRENVELMARSGFDLTRIRSIGGGARSDLWLQMKADVTGLPVDRPACAEAATMGAAMLAATGAGIFDTVERSAEVFYRTQRTFEPCNAHRAAYDAAYRRYQNLWQRLYPRD
jgi:xylulokinase